MLMSRYLVFAMLVFFPGWVGACPQAYSEYIAHMRTFLQSEEHAKINEEFADCYLVNKPLNDAVGELEYLSHVALITTDARVLPQAKRLYAALPTTVLRAKTINQLLDIAMIYRDVAFAKNLQAKHSLHRTLPPQVPPKSRRILLQHQQGSAQWQEFSFPQSGHVVVVGSEHCGFSTYLRDFLQSEAAFTPVLQQQMTWIAPVDRHLQSNPAIHDIYSPLQWPEIDDWDTPILYFYQHGRLVSKIAGWPKEGKRQELVAHLAAIGIVISAPPSPAW